MAAGYDTVHNFAPEMAVARAATGARALFRRALPVAAAFALGACAGGALDTGSLALPSVTLPKLELPKVDISKIELPKVELPEAALPVVGTPTEVYTRVARGAVNCWFGASGPLKGRYIYHASAESPARGGRAEISVHERDETSKDPRGGRALKIFIAAEGEATKVSYENNRIPADLSDAMRRDVDRWAADKMGCQPIPDQTAWDAETQNTPVAVAPAAKPKPKAAARTAGAQR